MHACMHVSMCSRTQHTNAHTHTHKSSSCNGCNNNNNNEAPCGLICGEDLWVYIGIFAPLTERGNKTLALPQAVPYKIGVRVAGVKLAHVLDLPTCAFAQVNLREKKTLT